MSFDDTRVHMRIAQQGRHIFETGFAINGSHLDPLDPLALLLFVHLARLTPGASGGQYEALGLSDQGERQGIDFQRPPRWLTHSPHRHP
jgi:hypothetical protein